MNEPNKLELLKENAFSAYESIFNKAGVVPVTTTTKGLRYVIINGVLFIEQNKNKLSPYGKIATNGVPILWGIENNRYLCRIHDGEYTLL